MQKGTLWLPCSLWEHQFWGKQLSEHPSIPVETHPSHADVSSVGRERLRPPSSWVGWASVGSRSACPSGAFRRLCPDWHLTCSPVRDLGFPGGARGTEPACQCRRCRRRGFDPWTGKIPWRRAWQPTPVFLPGESHGQRSPAGYSPEGRRVRHDWSN